MTSFPSTYPSKSKNCNCVNHPSVNSKSEKLFTGVKWTDDGPKKFNYSPRMANEPSLNNKESSLSFTKKAKIVEINGNRKYYLDGKPVSRETFLKSGLL